MPVLLLHLAAAQRMALRRGKALPPNWAHALDEDLAYARFGAALPLLPSLSGWGPALGLRRPSESADGFARRFHAIAPVRLGLKMAELAARGALVGEGPGRALIVGYFTHLCVDAALVPLEREGLERHVVRHNLTESSPALKRQVAWAHARAAVCDTLRVGDPFDGDLPELWRVTKSRRFAFGGVGRGIYELIRLSSQEALDEAPTKAQMDGWLQSLALQGVWASSPIGPLRRAARLDEVQASTFRHTLDGALDTCCEVLERLEVLMRSGRFGPRSRRQFALAFPSVGASSCAA